MTQVEEWVAEEEWAKVRKGLGRVKSAETMENLIYLLLCKPNPPLDILEKLITKRIETEEVTSWNTPERIARFLEFDGKSDCYSRSRPWVGNSFASQSLDVHRFVMRHVRIDQCTTYGVASDNGAGGTSTALRAIWRRFLKVTKTEVGRNSWGYKQYSEEIDKNRANELSNITSLNDASVELKEAWERTMLIVDLADKREKTAHEDYTESQRREEANRKRREEEERKLAASRGDDYSYLREPSLAQKSGEGIVEWTTPLEERVVHHLVKCNAPSVLIWFALRLFPEQALTRDVFGNLPLHYAIEQFHWPQHITTAEGCSLPEACALRLLLNAAPTAASYHNLKGETPLYCLVELSTGYTHRTYGSYKHGNIPLDLIMDLILAEPRSLITRDSTTHLLPFMAHASSFDYDKVDVRKNREKSRYSYSSPAIAPIPRNDPSFDLLYTLIREDPNAVSSGIKTTAYERYLEDKLKRLELLNFNSNNDHDGGGEIGSKRSRHA
jgi:hypothetical protein